MTDTKFTPGPWVHDAKYPFNAYSNDVTGSIVATCDGFKYAPRSDAEKTANAFLIATAPALYKTLEFVSNVLDEITEYPHVLSELEMNDSMRVDHALHEARVVMAKARGDHSSSG